MNVREGQRFAFEVFLNLSVCCFDEGGEERAILECPDIGNLDKYIL